MENHANGAGAQVTPERLMQMAWGFAPGLVVEAAVKNKVFDTLQAGPLTIAETSAKTGASERGLKAILNALVAFALLEKIGADRYGLSPESAAFLVSSSPASLAGFFTHFSGQLLPAWLQITESVAGGRPAVSVNQEGEGAEFFLDFVEAIFPMSYPAAKMLAGELRLSDASAPVNVLDIAAGSGVWGITLAQASPHVTITAVDWPKVTPVTQRVAARMGVGDRLTVVEGDLLEADFGTGHHVATLGHIFHSEGKARSRKLLAKVSAAMERGGTIAIAEFTSNDDHTGPPVSKIFAVNMLMMTDDGDTFSLPEMTAWLHEAGFKDVRTIASPGPAPLILATKA